MKFFVELGTKINIGGYKWTAKGIMYRNHGNAMETRYQIWVCDKTWLTISAEHFIRGDEMKWKVGRMLSAKTMRGAAALAAAETREALTEYVNHLAKYGDAVEQRYAKMILKKKGMTNEASN